MSDVNFLIEEELPIILLKEYKLSSHIKHYHAYMMKWNQKLRELLKAWLVEPENEFGKFAVAVEKCNVLIGHLSKGKTSRFAKTILFFLRGNNKTLVKLSYCENSEPWRWGRTSDTLQTPFYWSYKINWQVKIYFTGIITNVSFLFYFLPFFDHKRTKVWINEHIFALGIDI